MSFHLYLRNYSKIISNLITRAEIPGTSTREAYLLYKEYCKKNYQEQEPTAEDFISAYFNEAQYFDIRTKPLHYRDKLAKTKHWFMIGANQDEYDICTKFMPDLDDQIREYSPQSTLEKENSM